MATATDLLTLSQWFGASFPVGAYAYSHGLEAMVASGAVTESTSFAGWLRDVLERGGGRQDAILLSLAYRGNAAEVADLAQALASGRERQLETMAQGRAFNTVVAKVWGGDAAAWPYPVAAGAAAKASGLPLRETLVFYLQAFAGNLCTIAARAIPIGQSDAQAVQHSVAGLIENLVELAMDAQEADLGTSVFAADLAAIDHETQAVRIFRT